MHCTYSEASSKTDSYSLQKIKWSDIDAILTVSPTHASNNYKTDICCSLFFVSETCVLHLNIESMYAELEHSNCWTRALAN